MFFIFGFGSQSKTISTQIDICKHCGQMCRFEVFMTYKYFSFFFIPFLKWNQKYYVKTSCCGAIYTLSSEIGKKMEKGTLHSFSEKDLQYTTENTSFTDSYCGNCGAFRNGNQYCTKCGKKF